MSVPREPLWIVSEIFYPNQTSTGYILTEIADELVKYRDVRVICSEKNNDCQEKKEYIIIRTGVSFKSKSRSNLKKFFSSLLTTISIFLKVLVKCPTNAEILTVTNPALLVPFWWLLIKIKKFKVTLIVHDVFPNNYLVLNKSRNRLYFFIEELYRFSYKSFYRLIVIGRDMELFLKKMTGHGNVVLIENWADGSLIKGNGIEPKVITFQYAGNLGKLQNLDTIVKAFIWAANPNLVLKIRGRGTEKEMLNNLVQKYSNIQLLDSYNRDEESNVLNDCTVGIVSLKKEMLGLGVPSKAYNILSANKPILFFGNKLSEIGMVIDEFKIGWSIDSEDLLKLFFANFDMASLNQIEGEPRETVLAYYSKEKILLKYVELFI